MTRITVPLALAFKVGGERDWRLRRKSHSKSKKPETQAPQQITPLSADRWEKLHWLWAFLDEALLDYEDCLMATDPELKRELEARLREETVPFEELWLAVSREREENQCQSGG
jgi:hypothetical protein